MTGERLPLGPGGETAMPVVGCAAKGCTSKGFGVTMLGDDGQPLVGPPVGWGEIAAFTGDGDELVLFTCSPACERRLASGLASPGLGLLG